MRVGVAKMAASEWYWIIEQACSNRGLLCCVDHVGGRTCDLVLHDSDVAIQI